MPDLFINSGQHLNISREEMDVISLRSHDNVEKATADGLFPVPR